MNEIVACDRCGAHDFLKIIIDNGKVILGGNEARPRRVMLCPECTKEFDDWFDKFMREGRKSETEQG